MTEPNRVAVVGGGLAGLAAATALADRGFAVDLFEARRRLGGRASSFADPTTGELIDYCQHVSMGCCTNLADLCRRLKIDHLFRRVSTLHFIGPNGRQYDVAASRWLPAPFHLMPSLMRLRYLSRRDRWHIARTLLRLARRRNESFANEPTMGEWLRDQSQSPAAIERFWAVVLVSALGDSIEKVSGRAARKVFVDGFLANRSGYEVLVPDVPLGDLYGARIEKPLEDLGIRTHLNTAAQGVELATHRTANLTLADGSRRSFDFVVLATSWRHVAKLLPAAVLRAMPKVERAKEWGTAPITGVHLWFDRPITTLACAVLVGRLSQWMFYRGVGSAPRLLRTDRGVVKSCSKAAGVLSNGHYYQIVISAAHALIGVEHSQVVQRVCEELLSTWPAAQSARLLHSQVVTEKHAVFSPTPGLDAQRPTQRTPIANLMLAGDWTATDWPATMEGAVRSGYLAAEAVLGAVDKPALLGKPAVAPDVLVDDLPRARLARWLLK